MSPALAVIQKIRELKPETDILYIGGRLGMEGTGQPSIEQKVLPKTDIPHVFIHAGKLQRRWGLTTIFLLIGVVPGFFEALYQLITFKPQVLFSTGGYVSVPVVFAAWLLRIPIIIHEQTATVGLANKIASIFAKKIFVSFPPSVKAFPKEKVEVSGNPLRQEILRAVKRRNERGKVKYPRKIYITGGAQGSHLINQTILDVLPRLLKEFEVYLQCGDNKLFNDYELLKEKIETLDVNLQKRCHLVKYIGSEQIGRIFADADIVIGRSGANTVNEIAALGIPAIFIPIPWVTNNEQYKNARILLNAGSAIVLPEDQLTPHKFIELVELMKSRYQEYFAKAQEAKSLVKLDAGEVLARRILEIGQLLVNGKVPRTKS